MKKSRVFVLALAMMILFIASAQAITLGGAGYSNGRATWSGVSGEGSLGYDVYIDGHRVVSATGSSGRVQYTTPGEHTMYVVDIETGDRSGSASFTVPGASEPDPTTAPATAAPATEAPATEAPATEAPATEAPATEAPATQAPATEAPATQAPATQAPATEAPATVAPAATTDANSSSSDDDVPKTGDNTATMTMVILATLLMAAGYLFCTRKEK